VTVVRGKQWAETVQACTEAAVGMVEASEGSGGRIWVVSPSASGGITGLSPRYAWSVGVSPRSRALSPDAQLFDALSARLTLLQGPPNVGPLHEAVARGILQQHDELLVSSLTSVASSPAQALSALEREFFRQEAQQLMMEPGTEDQWFWRRNSGVFEELAAAFPSSVLERFESLSGAFKSSLSPAHVLSRIGFDLDLAGVTPAHLRHLEVGCTVLWSLQQRQPSVDLLAASTAVASQLTAAASAPPLALEVFGPALERAALWARQRRIQLASESDVERCGETVDVEGIVEACSQSALPEGRMRPVKLSEHLTLTQVLRDTHSLLSTWRAVCDRSKLPLPSDVLATARRMASQLSLENPLVLVVPSVASLTGLETATLKSLADHEHVEAIVCVDDAEVLSSGSSSIDGALLSREARFVRPSPVWFGSPARVQFRARSSDQEVSVGSVEAPDLSAAAVRAVTGFLSESPPGAVVWIHSTGQLPTEAFRAALRCAALPSNTHIIDLAHHPLGASPEVIATMALLRASADPGDVSALSQLLASGLYVSAAPGESAEEIALSALRRASVRVAAASAASLSGEVTPVLAAAGVPSTARKKHAPSVLRLGEALLEELRGQGIAGVGHLLQDIQEVRKAAWKQDLTKTVSMAGSRVLLAMLRDPTYHPDVGIEALSRVPCVQTSGLTSIAQWKPPRGRTSQMVEPPNAREIETQLAQLLPLMEAMTSVAATVSARFERIHRGLALDMGVLRALGSQLEWTSAPQAHDDEAVSEDAPQATIVLSCGKGWAPPPSCAASGGPYALGRGFGVPCDLAVVVGAEQGRLRVSHRKAPVPAAALTMVAAEEWMREELTVLASDAETSQGHAKLESRALRQALEGCRNAVLFLHSGTTNDRPQRRDPAVDRLIGLAMPPPGLVADQPLAGNDIETGAVLQVGSMARTVVGEEPVAVTPPFPSSPVALSMSRIQTFDLCPLSYALRYKAKIAPEVARSEAEWSLLSDISDDRFHLLEGGGALFARRHQELTDSRRVAMLHGRAMHAAVEVVALRWLHTTLRTAREWDATSGEDALLEALARETCAIREGVVSQAIEVAQSAAEAMVQRPAGYGLPPLRLALRGKGSLLSLREAALSMANAELSRLEASLAECRSAPSSSDARLPVMVEAPFVLPLDNLGRIVPEQSLPVACLFRGIIDRIDASPRDWFSGLVRWRAGEVIDTASFIGDGGWIWPGSVDGGEFTLDSVPRALQTAAVPMETQLQFASTVFARGAPVVVEFKTGRAGGTVHSSFENSVTSPPRSIVTSDQVVSYAAATAAMFGKAPSSLVVQSLDGPMLARDTEPAVFEAAVAHALDPQRAVWAFPGVSQVLGSECAATSGVLSRAFSPRPSAHSCSMCTVSSVCPHRFGHSPADHLQRQQGQQSGSE
jgi:hypothetical protein